jgi:4,5-dihydroxyphthalate decarboxylase
MSLQLTLACGDYDRTQPLIDGTVKPEGLELNWLTLPHGEIWIRMLNYYDFDASEISLSSYVTARTLHKPLTAIPVFPGRAFRHSYIFINTQSGIREPRDLEGKKLGLAEFEQTAAVWIRGILQHEYGVSLEKIHWLTWSPERRMEAQLPKKYDIQKIPAGVSPEKLLIEGGLDAVILTSLFPSLLNGAPGVTRLFENYKEVESAITRKLGFFLSCIHWRSGKSCGKNTPGLQPASTRLSSRPSSWLIRESMICPLTKLAWHGFANR